MSRRTPPKCRRCAETIHFIRTRKGKKMPCNTQKLRIAVGLNQKGPWTSVVTLDGDVVRGVRLADGETSGEDVEGYEPHWATCSRPNQFRRPRKVEVQAAPKAEQMDLFK